jgi:hypothetical protein
MSTPGGFAFSRQGDAVMITQDGKRAVTLRGEAAARFLAAVERGDPQQVMARASGNFKRGNERQARKHPRNR